jgi:hypothetical protein
VGQGADKRLHSGNDMGGVLDAPLDRRFRRERERERERERGKREEGGYPLKGETAVVGVLVSSGL